MTRAGVGALVALALTAGLALRLARLDVRPMHHDEANQAVKFGALLERGEYRYDSHDHHGPTLYYLSLPFAWLRGQTTLASLDERTLRGVTAAFGAATILLLPLVSSGIGRPRPSRPARSCWRSRPRWSSTPGCTSRSPCLPASRWRLRSRSDAWRRLRARPH